MHGSFAASRTATLGAVRHSASQRPRLGLADRSFRYRCLTHVPTSTLAQQVAEGNRVALARAITLVESTRADHQAQAFELLQILSHKMVEEDAPPSFRIGISGPPGVGKSTFIEALGKLIVKEQKPVAVLAVDPSSARTGGSILGDKTRMTELSRHPLAYVRPSPTCGTLGGVTRHTTEAILLCESAGYSHVLVETVGVGQSETAVEDMVDMFVLLVPPAGGDELQGIKKGIMELADLLIVNKQDGDFVNQARRTSFEYKSALKLMQPKWQCWRPRVQACSSLTDQGLPEIWATMQEFKATLLVRIFFLTLCCSLSLVSLNVLSLDPQKNGEFFQRRGRQRRSWLWKVLQDDLLTRFKQHASVRKQLAEVEEKVQAGLLPVGKAADDLLSIFLGSSSSTTAKQ
ncbi:Methylmalonyl Co-A mutase-associated GTPase MeaB [Balamuthia mandrillaris]